MPPGESGMGSRRRTIQGRAATGERPSRAPTGRAARARSRRGTPMHPLADRATTVRDPER